MRLYEIDDEDRSRAILSGIDMDIDNQYEMAKVLTAMIRNNKNPVLEQILLDDLVTIENKIQQVSDVEFADDESTKILKHKAKQMISHIRSFRNKL